MSNIFKDLETENGEHITVDGKRYYFTQQPYCDNNSDGEAAYFAMMISDSDTADEGGLIPAYNVMWSILPDWEGDDECDACDWENPDSISRTCWFDPADGRCI